MWEFGTGTGRARIGSDPHASAQESGPRLGPEIGWVPTNGGVSEASDPPRCDAGKSLIEPSAESDAHSDDHDEGRLAPMDPAMLPSTDADEHAPEEDEEDTDLDDALGELRAALNEEPEAGEEPRAEAEASGPDQLTRVRELLETTDVLLVLPSEAFVYFYPANPEQVINAAQRAGFERVYFEQLGDELVALEYLRIWRENEEKRTWIRSTSPLVIEYCRARHPELLPYLAPVVTPAVAVARWLRLQHPTERKIVYAGLDAPAANGGEEFAANLSLSELLELLREREADPVDQAVLLRSLPPERRRYLSAAGGLPLPMLDQERASSLTFRKLRGLHTLAGLSRLIRESQDGEHLGFVDVLPFEGPLDHPALGPHEELYWRRGILELAEPPRAFEPVITRPAGLDLSVEYEPKPSRLPEKEINEVERVLEEVGNQHDGQYWRRDPVGYAGYLSLAEAILRKRPELAVGLFHMSRTYSKAIRDASHDALTDLYSYRALVERLEEEMGQANRAGTTLAMIFVDLDNFKEINDEHGHPVGNEMLRRVADVLRQTIRSTDIAGRFGGDEFVVLLVNADPQGAVRVAEQIRQRIAQIQIQVPNGHTQTTASIGLAFHSGTERSLLNTDDLFAEADASLYIAKAHGGNRVHPVVREEPTG